MDPTDLPPKKEALLQTIEEFASLEAHREHHTERLPPNSIQFSYDEQSCASSITTAHFQNAELFVPSMYPSIEGIRSDPQPEIMLESQARALGTVLQEDSLSRAEAKITLPRKEKEYDARGQTTTPDHNNESHANLDLDAAGTEGHIELPEVNRISDGTIQNRSRIESKNLTKEEVLGSIMNNALVKASGMTMAHRPSVSEARPGAYPISTPGCQDSSRGTEEETAHNNRREPDLGLVEAQPVPPLPMAEASRQDEGTQNDTTVLLVSRQCRLILSLTVAALLSAILTLGVNAWQRDPARHKEMQIRALIEEAFGMEYFDSKLKEKALHWVVHKDPQQDLAVKMGREADSNQLIQRYSLVAFYFQTSSVNPWTYCNPPESKQSDICFFQVQRTAAKPQGQQGFRWLSASHECQWMGLFCPEGSKSVTKLNIWNNNMTGPIPSELAKLCKIDTLKLSGNSFSGELPTWIGELPSIGTLYLSANKFTGRIPSSYFSNPNLNDLRIASNLLTGPIPSQIGFFLGKLLLLQGNLLTGKIPDDAFSLTNLQQIYLHNNAMSGSLPPQIGKLTSLRDFHIGGSTLIHGSLPSEVALLDNLFSLGVILTGIEGSIPQGLYSSATDLQLLLLSNNKISGTISSRVGLLTELRTLDLKDNQLGGKVPGEISMLTHLRDFNINGNADLTGSIPAALCAHMPVNGKLKFAADCTPRASTGIPAVACPDRCCGTCCDVDTKICIEK